MIRLASLLETGFLLLVLHLSNLAFFQDDPAFLGLNPHPLFAVVVLSSLRYSRVDSLAATVLTAGGLLAEAWYFGLVESGLASSAVFRIVVLLVITNLVLGELGGLFYREMRESRERISELEKSYRTLKVQYDALQLVKDELSERIVGQTSSILSLYEAAKRLESLDTEQIHAALLEITAKFIGAESCSLFLARPEERSLVLERSHGWTPEERRERGEVSIGFGSEVLGKVAAEGRMVTLKELTDDRALAESAAGVTVPTILAAPLMVEDKVHAVLNVERIPFLKYSPTNIRLFYLIADLGSTALANSQRFQRSRRENIVDADTGLATVAFLETSLTSEIQRNRRTGVPFSFCLMQIDGEDEIRKALGKKMDRFQAEVARLALQSKREIDVAAILPSGEMAFVLPCTAVEGAAVFTRKIQANVLGKIKVSVEDKKYRPSASFGVTAPQGQGELTKEDVVQRARRALRTAMQDGRGNTHVDLGEAGMGAGVGLDA